MTVNNITKLLLSSFLLAGTGAASAAAFQLSEVSTSGLGRAYSGEAAIADNAAVVATNPALMGVVQQPVVSVGTIYVDPSIDIESTQPSFNPAKPKDSFSHKNIAPNAVVPNFYAVYPLNTKFAMGGGVNVNYGLASKFNKDYAAGWLGGKTDLMAVNFNLSGAYRLTDNLIFGVGLNAVYAKATLERYAGQLFAKKAAELQAKAAAAKAAGITPTAEQVAEATAAATALTELNKLPANTVVSRLKGDKWGFGWNAGLVYEFNERNRIGVAYHSQVNINFKGKYSNQLPTDNPVVVAVLKQSGTTATGGNEINGSLHLPLPAYWEVSGFHQLTDKLAVHYSYKHTQWSKFKELRAKAADGSDLFRKEEKFSDSSRIAIGATYDVNEKLTLRTGIAHDESAAQDHHSISIPDTDRTWYAVGATYNFTPNLSVDAGFAHLRGKKHSFVEEGVKFTVKGSANIYGLNLNYRF